MVGRSVAAVFKEKLFKKIKMCLDLSGKFGVLTLFAYFFFDNFIVWLFLHLVHGTFLLSHAKLCKLIDGFWLVVSLKKSTAVLLKQTIKWRSACWFLISEMQFLLTRDFTHTLLTKNQNLFYKNSFSEPQTHIFFLACQVQGIFQEDSTKQTGVHMRRRW